MSEMHSTGKPELGKPGLTINDDHGAAAPGDELLAEEAAIDTEVEAQLINLAGAHSTVLQFFSYAHLKAELKTVSRDFALLAIKIMSLPSNPMRTIALNKLIEAKDAAVRAKLQK